MIPKDVIEQAEMRAARDAGWEPRNGGEARVALVLPAGGVMPDQVEQQFRLGSYHLDLAFVRARVAIEADGWIPTTRTDQERDRARDRHIGRWEWKMVRFAKVA